MVGTTWLADYQMVRQCDHVVDLDFFLIGKDIPVNMHGDVDPDYWEEEILPTLQDRFDRWDYRV